MKTRVKSLNRAMISSITKCFHMCYTTPRGNINKRRYLQILYMLFQDPDIPVIEKVNCVLDGLDNNDEDNFNQVIGEYEFTQSSVILEVLEELVLSPRLVSDRKYNILSSMYSVREDLQQEDKDRLEQLISAYIPTSSVLEFETVKWLFSFGNGTKHLPRLFKYLGNANLQDLTRYNQIFSLKKLYPEETLEGIKYMTTIDIGSRCMILCSQYLLENGSNTSVIEKLFQIAEDEKEEYNARADAADTLHHYTFGEQQEKALSILRGLGGNSANIYEDKQNVHTVDISQGLALIGEFTPKTKYADIAKILGAVKDTKISASLGRIVMDTARYGKASQSAKDNVTYTAEEILERIWEYIKCQEKEMRSALLLRLTEELRDMADTCSSGHALRLINVLSGYGANISISFIDQIASSFEGRLNARLRLTEDEDLLSDILSDLTDHGPKFMEFFGQNFQSVIDELREEYVEGGYVSIDDFDVAITKAMKPYEGNYTSAKIEFKVLKRDDDEG
jgi:hypothetical protein